MSEGKEPVLVMYDVRGIQDYIFRTSKMKDAIGASAIVEDIFEETLQYALETIRREQPITSILNWNDDDNLQHFKDDADVVVLYIGGGNAVIRVCDRKLAVRINKLMSRRTIEQTYSLQMACAIKCITGNYAADYESLNREMTRIKENMAESKPLGALPVMKIEYKTGYPVSADSRGKDESRETLLKKSVSEKKRDAVSRNMKLIDSYVTEKGVDSTVAIVHIDGNNMGLRIRGLLEHEADYSVAVPLMRRISNNINSKFKNTFNEMEKFFNRNAGMLVTEFHGKTHKNCFVSKVLVAGDDITYICNGKIALATVKFFADHISREHMIDEAPEGKALSDYAFSVCGGIAYIGSHFPFHIGYDVAEACCASAKNRAKRNVFLDRAGRTGNWVDFHVCKNMQSKNLDRVRKAEYEYKTGSEESLSLLRRPYRLESTGEQEEPFLFDEFDHAVKFFARESKLSRSQLKQMRNTYPLGEKAMQELMSFLSSRGRELPEGDMSNVEDAYFSCIGDAVDEKAGRKYAKYYDALEMADMYIPLQDIIPFVEQER